MCHFPPLHCLPILSSMLLLPSFLLLWKEFLAQGRQFFPDTLAIQSFARFLTSCWTSLLLPPPSFLCLFVFIFFMFYLLFSCFNIVTLICYVMSSLSDDLSPKASLIYPKSYESGDWIMYYSTFYALQIIILSYWVVALIINIPCVMITEVDGTTGECREFMV